MSGWGGKRVAVTGAGGFIGSHLVERLVELGSSVRALVRYNSRNDRGALTWLPPEILAEVETVSGDVRDPESVARFVSNSEVVFHLAALIAIPYSYLDPRSFFETNVMGTLNVVHSCRTAETVRLVHTSTSEVYGTAQSVPITEDHPLVGQSPYAASKIGADQLVMSFHHSYGVPACILRPFNTYGPRQSERAVIPTIVVQALRGEVVRLGSLDPSRDVTFVRDTVEGFLAIAACDDALGKTLQLGTGQELTVGELVEAIGDVVGRCLTVEQEPERVRPHTSEVLRLVSSPRRMTELTGWKPQTTLREGLEQTVAWIESRPELYRADEYVI